MRYLLINNIKYGEYKRDTYKKNSILWLLKGIIDKKKAPRRPTLVSTMRYWCNIENRGVSL